MSEFIPLASPDIRDTDIALVNEVLRSGMLIQSKYVAELENGFLKRSSTNFASAVSNGTATMHLVLRALDIKHGDEVIVPAFSYVATANVVELVGATPVFVDIDLDTFNIDVAQIEKVITSKTKAIIPVHEFGLACNIEAVMQIANKHNLFVIEDAACAFGAHQNNKPVGSFGIAGSFSLHPRKSITSGEGGIVTSNDENLIKKVNILKNHGVEIINQNMEFVEAGFNYRMTDFQAALAVGQLERFDDTLIKKSRLAEVYFNEIKNPKIKLPFVPNDRNHTWQTFHIMLDDSLNQKDVIQYFKDRGVGVNYGAQCIPYQQYYAKKYNHNSQEKYPNAFAAYKQGIALPLYEKLTETQIEYISKIVNEL